MSDQRFFDAGSMSKVSAWILHPFLFGAFFVLALITSNLGEVIAALTIRPLIISLVLPGALLLLFRLFVRDWRKAALADTGILILFFTYGRLHAELKPLQPLGISLVGHRPQGVLWLILGGAWIYLAGRRLNATAWTSALNVFGLILVAVPTAQILYFASTIQGQNATAASALQNAAPLPLRIPPRQSPPDIYYIILDMYGREDLLKEMMGFDNGPFLDRLSSKGFYVAPCSLSNYIYTTKSLASSLNMARLDELDPSFARPNEEIAALYPYLKNNRVRKALEAVGYRFVAFETSYAPLNFDDADVFYDYSGSAARAFILPGLNPFESVLLETTAGTVLFDVAPQFAPLNLDFPYTQYRGRMLNAMDKIHDAVRLPGPKFVFMHLMAPHDPFVFGPNGEPVERLTPFTQTHDPEYLDPDAFVKGYTDEIVYLNQRMDELTSYILANSQTPPIIIIQGDHGLPRYGSGSFVGWHNANLSTYYLPGEGASALYPTITPINSFRVILNQYFDAGLPLEEDVACSNPGNSFGCRVVHDPNPACAARKQP